ncbi:MAG: LamG domain-containing protein [Candidatus Nanohaloarchaea archaeon]
MNFKFLILVLTLGLISGIAAGFEGGSGTSGDPYQISTCQQLQDIELDLSATYELVGNLNCTETKNWNSDKGFKPVGNSTNRFTGVFDGNNYVVKGLFIDRTSEYYTGLFGYTEVSTIVKNLNLEDATVRGSVSTGLVAGRNEGNLQNISISGEVYGANANTGGLTGLNDGNISLSTVKIALESDSFRVGGLTGWNRGSGRIENSKVFGSISGQDNVGGLAGTNSFKINNSTSYVSIDGRNRVGGLVGYTDDSEADVSQSSSAGTVNGSSDIGGLVGYHTNSKIMESYSTSNVKGDTNVGGLIGLLFAADVSNSFSTGEVAGSSLVGGLVGERDDSLPGTVSDSYWDINSSGQFTSTGGTGLTTSEMIGSAASSNMAGFDFQDTWSTQSFYYPRLQWMELGSGTEADPFIIYNCRELQALNNSWDDHYQLANDIDCSDTVNWESGKGFYPIARDAGFSDGFGGSLDGANRKISGLYINRSTNSRVGMFGKIYSGNVREVKIDSFNISGSIRTGTLSAAVDGSSVITNISVRNSEVNAVEEGTGTSSVGGVIGDLVGGSAENMRVYNSVIYGGQSGVGGVVGVNEGSTHNLSSFSNEVDGRAGVGAVFGDVEGFATNSYADNASIVGEFDIGGISGGAGSFSNSELSNATIENSEIILTSSDSGGVVGGVGSDAAISDVRSLNNTIDSQCGSSCTDVGGIVGELSGGTVKNSYSASNEFLGSYSFTRIGILAGRLSSSAELNDSYWDDDKATVSGAIGQNSGSSSNLIGLTTSEMQGCNSVQNMDLFDFENTWIAQSNDYPALRFFSSEGLSCDAVSLPLTPTLLLPSDGATEAPVKTNLSVTAEGTGLQNITFYQNNSGTDTEIGTVTDVNASNSEIAQFEWSGLNTTTEYDWYAVAENLDGSATSDTWSFTTEKNPWIENPRPDGSVVRPSPELNLTVLDDVDNQINVSVYDSEDNLIGSGAVNSGDRGSFSFNNANEIGKIYEWYTVLETDSGLEMNSSASSEYPDYWNFTVVDNFFRINSASEWLEGDFNGSAVWNDSDVIQTGYLSGEDETSTGGYETPGLDSLVGQWRLNDVQSSNNVEDYSGVNNPGSVEGGASVSPGLFSRDAVSFDGQDDYIDIPYAADYDLEAFTVSVWFKTSSLPEEIGVISNKQVDYNNRNWWLAIDNGQGVAGQDGGVALRTSSSGEIVTLNAQNDYRDGEWHHAVAVMDPQNNEAGLYIDGVLEDSETQNVGAPDLQSSPIYLGMEVGSSDRFFDGQLSDHTLIDKPLNASEVRQLYFNGNLDYKASYTSKTVTELGVQEWKSLNISGVSVPDNTSINVTVEASNDFNQEGDDSQTFELDGDLNQALNLPDTKEVRIIFEGDSQEEEKSWNIDDVILVYGDSSSTGINAEINSVFGDRVNMNNGSADIGRTDLEFEPWNPAQGVMEVVNVDVDGVQAASFNDVPSNSTRSVDISTLGLSEDQVYTWSVSVEEAGLEVGSINGEFSTHTVDIEAVPQDDSHDSINLYYSEDGTSFKRLDSFSTSDSSPLTVKAANSELFNLGNHCYTAATSRSGLESSQSPGVCIGGDIP